ncbi:MAG: OmpA family protein [Proteobacteria bacterium]|nr:OmpA family protein [Pseudomonadota bacterium]
MMKRVRPTGLVSLLGLATSLASCTDLTSEVAIGTRAHALEATAEQCYLVADIDDEDGEDVLSILDKNNPTQRVVGSLGANAVEAIAFNPGTATLYGADADQLGIIDINSPAFRPLGKRFGRGQGALGTIALRDVDGLSFDPATGLLYGSVRRDDATDLLIIIDRTTGAHVPNGFGQGVGYVEIPAIAGNRDIDDLAIDIDGTMYAIANSGGDNDHLVTIDRATGQTTDIAMIRDGEVALDDIEGLGFDTSGQLWGSSGDGNTLYRIDKNTGQTMAAVAITEGEDFESIDCLIGALPGLGQPDGGPGQPDAGPEEPDAGTGGELGGDDWSVVGGGCSASSRAPGVGPATLVALVLAALALGLARRRRTLWSLILAVAITAGVTTSARAQIASDFTLERFRISLDREGVLDSEWGTTLGHLQWDVGLWLGWANDPLVVVRSMEGGDSRRIGDLVSRRLGGNLVATVGFLSWLQAGLEVPLIVSQGQDIGMSPVGTGGAIAGSGLGDIRVVPKVQLLRSDKHVIDLAIIPAFFVPTSTSEDYFGEGAFSFAPELAVSRALGAVRMAGNLGYRTRNGNVLGDLTVDDEIFWRLGAGYRFADAGGPPFEIDLSLTAATRADEFFQRPNNDHVELIGGLQYLFSEPLLGFAAAGMGLNEGFGTPDWRILVGMRFNGRRSEDRLVVAESPLPPQQAKKPACEPNGWDCDGLLDPPDPRGEEPGIDLCPEVPGLPEHFGCPGPVVTVNEPPCEKLEVSQKLEFDKASATIRPHSLEILRRDIVSVLDDHPDLQVTIEGHTSSEGARGYNVELSKRRARSVQQFLSEQGIAADRLTPVGHGSRFLIINPDTGKEDRDRSRRIEFRITAGGKCPLCEKIDIGRIQFKYNSHQLEAGSKGKLDRLAGLLEKRVAINLRIEGHTSSKGSDEYNRQLSARRANAVRAYLIERGITVGRLTSIGRGEENLKENPDDTPVKREVNRRVEFVITDGGRCDDVAHGPLARDSK